MTSGGKASHQGATDWAALLQVWMSDPVDKAIDIREYLSRAEKYLSVALGHDGAPAADRDQGTYLADQLATLAECVPMPVADTNGEHASGFKHGYLDIRHPLSAKTERLDCHGLDEEETCSIIREIAHDLNTPRERFLALWRMLPDRIGFPMNRLPADTRIPDHTLIDHMDTVAGLWASVHGMENTVGGRAILGFALGPVQPFIAAARSLRDLWTGSVILSCVAFAAMRPILEHFGPTAFVYPALRGNPLMDLWLRYETGIACVPEPDLDALYSPSLPHRFVALVPWGYEGETAHALAEKCKQAAREEWLRLSMCVREELSGKLDEDFPGWERLWEDQCHAVFEFRTTTVPEQGLDDDALAHWLGERCFEGAWPEAGKVRRLQDAIPASCRPGYNQKSSGRWQAQLDISTRIMEAERIVRHVSVVSEFADAGQVPLKCTLFGSFEQMGPANLAEAKRFWDDVPRRWRVNGVRLRKNEHFCAVALTKRFAMPVALTKRLRLGSKGLRFPDTATIAAANWLDGEGIDPNEYHDWNGRWLHDSDDALKEDGEDTAPQSLRRVLMDARETSGQPPVYYAILMMDGDKLGGWLRGDHSPKLRQVMHPDLLTWFDTLGDERVEAALAARRPVDPTLHAAISGALGRFASCLVPSIVRSHRGRVIYSGGDDLLAVLPAVNAVACARALHHAYREGAGPEKPGMGSEATISAGLVYVHYKEDLRFALQSARDSEKHAKEMGRDALGVRFIRRSGEHTSALLDWQNVEWFVELVGLFMHDDASNRWAYRLRAELPVLKGQAIPATLVEAEIRRLGNRIDDRLQQNGDRDSLSMGQRIAGWWRAYREARRRRSENLSELSPDTGKWLSDFTVLCQGAAFVARGRDD